MVMDVSPEKSTSPGSCGTASDQCVNQILAARPESWPHAIDATPARRRGGVGASPLDGAGYSLIDFRAGIDEWDLHIFFSLLKMPYAIN